MRINQQEISIIKNSFRKIFKTGNVFLFGSRVDDKIKGGDIDLYIVPKTQNNLRKKKIQFLVDLKLQIGDQKIDVVLARGKNTTIEQEAVKTGVLL